MLAGNGGTGGTSSPASPGLPGTIIGRTRSPRSAFALLIGSSPAELDDEGGRRPERGRPVMELLREVVGRDRGGGGVVGVFGGVTAGIAVRASVLTVEGIGSMGGGLGTIFSEPAFLKGFGTAGGAGRARSPSLAESKPSALTTLSVAVDILCRLDKATVSR